MSKLRPDIYLTADDLAERLKDRLAKANALPPSLARQAIMSEIFSLRAYADKKRWIERRN